MQFAFSKGDSLGFFCFVLFCFVLFCFLGGGSLLFFRWKVSYYNAMIGYLTHTAATETDAGSFFHITAYSIILLQQSMVTIGFVICSHIIGPVCIFIQSKHVLFYAKATHNVTHAITRFGVRLGWRSSESSAVWRYWHKKTRRKRQQTEWKKRGRDG